MHYKHGHAAAENKTKTYDSWRSMRKRCNNPKNIGYKNYGGRGISVCERWLHSFENFFEDMGEAPKGLTLERKNNDGNYEPGNCIWATYTQQLQNSRRTKLNPLKVRIIRWLSKESKLTQRKISRIFGVATITIGNVVQRKSWTNIH